MKKQKNESSYPSDKQRIPDGQYLFTTKALDFIFNPSADKGLFIKEAVANIGTKTEPEYYVCVTVANKGNKNFDCKIAQTGFIARKPWQE